MKRILLILVALSFGNLYSQTNGIGDYEIDKFVRIFNNLPITSVTGKENFEYQSKYFLKWNKKNGDIKIKETRYKPNSKKKAPDNYQYSFNVSSIHNEGIFIKSIYGSGTVNLIIYSMNNNKTIRKKAKTGNRKRMILYDDRFTFGPWEEETILDQLTETKNSLVLISGTENVCTSENKPDINMKSKPYYYDLSRIGGLSVEFKFDDGEPVFINSTLDNPALISGSESEKENIKIIEKYITKELKKQSVILPNEILGYVIISKDGVYEDFVPLTDIELSTIRSLEKILSSMPEWTAGIHNEENVRISQVIRIKK
ncbi:MAG: hypothetical protein K9G61_03440 [Bacteroidales bacterium]|nr:hypothetical protein [Bacteroidales bacterium]